MLRLSRDRVLIALAPASLAMVRLQASAHGRVSDKRVLEYNPVLGVESWQRAAEALAEVASELRDVRCDVTIVLSNHFVRYAVVPASEGLDPGEEELSFARHCFAKIHGARSKSWDVRMSAGQADQDRLASAIDGTLLQTVQTTFPAGGRPRLVSVQPYLMSAFNQWRNAIRLERAWFLLLEPQRFCLSYLENGRWGAVRNTKAALDAPEQWAELLEREQHLIAGAEPPADVYVHAPQTAAAASPHVEGWNFRSLSLRGLSGLSADEAVPLSMALSAA